MNSGVLPLGNLSRSGKASPTDGSTAHDHPRPVSRDCSWPCYALAWDQGILDQRTAVDIIQAMAWANRTRHRYNRHDSGARVDSGGPVARRRSAAEMIACTPLPCLRRPEPLNAESFSVSSQAILDHGSQEPVSSPSCFALANFARALLAGRLKGVLVLCYGLTGPGLERKARRFSLAAKSVTAAPGIGIGASEVKVYADAEFTFVSADAHLASVPVADRRYPRL
jgi:hypothetical protein